MTKTITFNELRRIKDALPSGSMAKIANELGLEKQTVKNYFGGTDYKEGKIVGLHIEPGPDGGVVQLDDTVILDVAQRILDENQQEVN
jgi:predicted transcriptional regulator